MRVLFLAHSFPRFSGDAAGSFLLRLAIALGEFEQIEVFVLAPGARGLPANESFDGVGVFRYRYAPRALETLAYAGTMAEEVKKSWMARAALLGLVGSQVMRGVAEARRLGADLIHAHWWFPAGMAGTWISALAHTPLVTTMHGSDVRLAGTVPAARSAMRYVLTRSASVTAVSGWLASEARRIVPEVVPVIAPMPADTVLFGAQDTKFRGSRSKLLYVGRLNSQKGIEHAIRALALMRTPVSLDVVGDGPLREPMRALASELGIGDRIQWLGTLPQPALAALYASAAALVTPSTKEGLGLVAAEAMLCRTPVVAFASGGLTDIVRDDETGLLVKEGDTAGLAHACDALLSRPDRGASLGEAGRRHAVSLFSPAAAAARYAAVYRSAVAEV